MLNALFRPQNAASTTSVWGDWGDTGMETASGERVTVDTALQLVTVYGCVRLISDGISTLPVDVFRTDVDGKKVTAPKPAWLERPTVDLDFPSWCGQVLSSMLLQGNSYWYISRSQGGGIVEVVPLDPGSVQVLRRGGRKVLAVNGQEVPSAEIKHVPGLMLPGSDVGMSPIEYARQSIGLGLAAMKFGGDFFQNEGNMPGVIESPNPMMPEVMDNLAKQWRRKRRSGGKGLPGILQAGATWKPTGVTNEQAQFLATRQYTASEIAGQMFLVDPSELGIPVAGSTLKYANLEQLNVRRVQVTMLPWIVRIENAISDLLMRPRYMKFNVEGLLRGDQKTRYESYQIGINSGFMVPNEAREKEDWEPLSAAAQVPVTGGVPA